MDSNDWEPLTTNLNRVKRVWLQGRLAQLVEHRPFKPRVTGSNPVPPTSSLKDPIV